MVKEDFAGDKKAPMRSPLAAVEHRFIHANVHRFPPWIKSYQLTLLTIPWSVGVLVSGYLAARGNLHWLWGSSLMLFLQWFTDSFDGSLGRHRDAGLVKWGFHMDHFLDFVFMWCVVAQYAFLVDGASRHIVYALAFLYGAVMVNSWLDFAITNEFKITYLGMGPTEIRLFFIVLNTLLIHFGTGFLEAILPYALILWLLLLSAIVYRTQKAVWAMDMADKQRRLEREQEATPKK